MNTTNRESAVSEVISVVLVVALTVILAAIVAANMFGMVPTIPTSRTIALTTMQDGPDQVIIVYHGGPDQATLVSMNITWPSGTVQLVTQPRIGDAYTGVNPVAGIPNATPGKADHVVVAGDFGNGVNIVILDTYV